MKSARRAIIRVGGNRFPHLHLSVLIAAVKTTRLWGRRGFGRLCRALGRNIFGVGNYADLAISPNCVLRLYLFDGYWSYLLFPEYDYEPEIGWLLSKVATMKGLAFLDCGANVGYWSLLAEKQYGFKGPIVAVEGSPITFERLVENLILNEAKTISVNAGVWSHESEAVEFAADSYFHEGGVLVGEGFPKAKHLSLMEQRFRVPTITIDSIVARHIPRCCRLIIKLDLEGAEIDALVGAASTLQDYDTLLIYEDHGSDEDCVISSHLLDEGYLVFHHLSTETQSVSSILEIQALKTNRGEGYNFFACRPGSAFLSAL